MLLGKTWVSEAIKNADKIGPKLVGKSRVLKAIKNADSIAGQ
jgi:hypothetical protein